jgi:hypothetical protein
MLVGLVQEGSLEIVRRTPITETTNSLEKVIYHDFSACFPRFFFYLWVEVGYDMQQAGYFSRDMKAREPQKGRPRRNPDRKPMDSEQLFQYISGGWGCGW